MKILGFIMGNKVLTAVIAIILVAALYFSVAGVGSDWEAGAPEMTIQVEIHEVGSVGVIDLGSVGVGDRSALDAAIKPASTFVADVDPLLPGSLYTISITASVIIQATSSEERGDFTTSLVIGGTTGDGYTYVGHSTQDIIVSHNTETFISSTDPLSTWYISFGDPPVAVTGMVIDGSVITVSVIATSNTGGVYTTIAYLELNVLPGGVGMEVTGVSTNVS